MNYLPTNPLVVMSPRWCSTYWTPSCEEVMLLDEEAVDACISQLWRQISEQLASRHDATSLFFPTKTKQQIKKKEMKRKGTRVSRSGIYLFFLKRMLVDRQRFVRFLWQFSTTHLYSEIGDGGVEGGGREPWEWRALPKFTSQSQTPFGIVSNPDLSTQS